MNCKKTKAQVFIWVVCGIFHTMLNAQSTHKKNDANSHTQPNVIFFAVDDMNDWAGPLGYNQVITPNMDRLAKSGVTFSNAHAPGSYCAPSRSAIWTGLQATTTGCYGWEVFHYDYPELVSIQMAFKQGGYNTYGAGKLYHHGRGFVDMRSWDAYFSRSQEVRDSGWEMDSYQFDDVPLPDPYPYGPYYNQPGKKYKHPFHLEWGPIANEQEDDMADAIRTNWMVDMIEKEHDKPFFMALGMYSPHYPNYAPQKYFDMYDRDAIVLPPYKEDDLEDLSPEVQKMYNNRKKQHKELEKLDALKDAMHGYLAAITFADAMLGRIIDAVEASPYRDNTIIVLWSDQGFHHGEKGHWGKHTLWQRTTQVPFIWSGPGIADDKEVKTTVGLIDIYPTLKELCALPVDNEFDGVSLAKTLKKPSKAKERNVFVPHHIRGNYAVVNSKWRYIQYKTGAEELYNLKKDPNEWKNLAGDKKYQSVIKKMKKSVPETFAPNATPFKQLKLVIEGDSFHWEKKTKK